MLDDHVMVLFVVFLGFTVAINFSELLTLIFVAVLLRVTDSKDAKIILTVHMLFHCTAPAMVV